MDDELFPSGPWTGFYNYTGPEDRRRMDLHLTFDNGRITGDGTDDIGTFLIAGRYNATSRDCDWVKTYPGSHNVFYRGFRDGAGIWGTWEIPPFSKGGFHIWPRQSGNGEHATRAAQVELPVEAIATEDAASQGNKPTGLGGTSAPEERNVCRNPPTTKQAPEERHENDLRQFHCLVWHTRRHAAPLGLGIHFGCGVL